MNSGKELELDVLKVYPDCLSQPSPVLSLNATLGPRVVCVIPRIPIDSTQTSVKDNFPYHSWWEMGFSLMLTVWAGTHSCCWVEVGTEYVRACRFGSLNN